MIKLIYTCTDPIALGNMTLTSDQNFSRVEKNSEKLLNIIHSCRLQFDSRGLVVTVNRHCYRHLLSGVSLILMRNGCIYIAQSCYLSCMLYARLCTRFIG